MGAKWTPGPWKSKYLRTDHARDGCDSYVEWSLYAESGTIARLMSRAPLLEADARLIAAAPEMAGLLARMLKAMEYHRDSRRDPEVEEARALLARINGQKESHGPES